MKKKFVKVMAAMTVAVLIVGNTTVVAEAHHSRSSRAAVQGKRKLRCEWGMPVRGKL